MANRYWVGGTGTWNATNTTEWAAESGGAPGASAPTATDNVIFDAKSGLTSATTVNVAAGAVCSAMTIEGLGEIFATFSQAATEFAPAGAVTIKGKSAVFRVLWRSSVFGTQRTFKASAATLANIDFADIKAAGAAAPLKGEIIGDALGNAEITFTGAEAQTRNGAGSNWSDVTKWTSRVPLPQDDVVIDSGSSGTIKVDCARLGKKIDFTGFKGTINFNLASSAYGSVLMNSEMKVEGALALTLAGRAKELELKTAGLTMTMGITQNGPGGSYKLAGELVTEKALTVTMGEFNCNGKNIKANNFIISNKVELSVINFPSATTMTLTGTTAAIWNGTLSVDGYAVANGANLTLVIATATATNRTIDILGEIFGTITYTVAGSTGSLKFNGATAFGSQINTLNFSDATNARTLEFQNSAGGWQVTTFNVNGASGKLVTLKSSAAGSQVSISKSSGTVTCEYLAIKDCKVGGGATFYDVEGVNEGNNTGWVFRRRGAATPSGNGSATLGGRRRRLSGAKPTGNSFASDVGVRRRFSSGTTSGSSAATATGARRRRGAASVSGGSFASDAGIRRRYGGGSPSAAGAATAAGARRRHGGGEATGTSFMSDEGVRRRVGAGAASGSSEVEAPGRRRRFGGGAAQGNSYASDVGVRRRFGAGGVSGASDASLGGTRRRVSAAAASGLGTALLALRRLFTVPGFATLEDASAPVVTDDEPTAGATSDDEGVGSATAEDSPVLSEEAT